ncbi:MAG: alpha/beta hydrolase [Armatimonadetes bacterium]|nr:alpha/beta hydrolase [Armatimonadota bacterium]
MARYLLVLLLFVFSTIPALAEELPFVPAWMDEGTKISDSAAQAAVDALAARDADPTNIAVLIHGFATPRADSTAQFTVIGNEVNQAFRARGQEVLVLGIQWDSNPGKMDKWLPQVALDTMLGIIGLASPSDDPYIEKVHMARNVGRLGARQVLVRVRQRFPRAKLHFMAHSLGSEVTLHAVDPRFREHPEDGGPLPSYEPQVKLNPANIVLCGADLNYDLLYKSNVGADPDPGGYATLWLTVAPAMQNRFDLVLEFRRVLRGDAALGNKVPRMRVDQTDLMYGMRKIYFDTHDIPADHSILTYYNAKRVDRVSELITWQNGGGPEPKDFKILDAIVASSDVPTLAANFNNLNLCVQLYALWRLDNLLCGSCMHFADGYTRSVAKAVEERPQAIPHIRETSPCRVVRSGLWPTNAMIQTSLDRQPGEKARVHAGRWDPF